MKALFLTTKTGDCRNHVMAWESAFCPAEQVTFNHEGIRNDQVIIDAVRAAKPDVIFYIGAMKGLGNPRAETFQELRRIAPTINFCSDSADRPWHPVLATYARMRCFDLQVGIDGPSDAPVDLSTLTPVDTRSFDIEVDKDIRFGFSGSVGNWNGRSEIVKSLSWFGGLEVLPSKRHLSRARQIYEALPHDIEYFTDRFRTQESHKRESSGIRVGRLFSA